jgi:hypothetical protein
LGRLIRAGLRDLRTPTPRQVVWRRISEQIEPEADSRQRLEGLLEQPPAHGGSGRALPDGLTAWMSLRLASLVWLTTVFAFVLVGMRAVGPHPVDAGRASPWASGPLDVGGLVWLHPAPEPRSGPSVPLQSLHGL